MQIVTIILSIVSCSMIMGMDQTIYFEQQPIQNYPYALKRTPETEAQKLAIFAYTEHITETDITFALGTAKWLVKKRKDIVEHREWITFVNNFTKKIEGHYCPCPCIPHKKLDAVIHAIKQTTCIAKSGDDFSQVLVDRAQEEMHKAVQDFNKMTY